MQNPLELPASESTQRLLDLIGGEPLDDSGFETEQTDPAFVTNEIGVSDGEA